MAENTKIEWCDHTFNPWRGCAKVSPGCENCYAEKQAKRNPKVLGTWGPGGKRVVASEAAWKEPLKWDRAAAKSGRPALVFCGSMCDVFESFRGAHNWEALQNARWEMWKTIRITPNLTWLLLTKRPENAQKEAESQFHFDYLSHGKWPSNAWLGVSVEDQQRADERIPELLRLKAQLNIPGVFLSCEPLLGYFDPRFFLHKHAPTAPPFAKTHGQTVDWVICGGESGPKARPCHPDWVRLIRNECSAAGVPFFFKQWGAWAPQYPALCGKKQIGGVMGQLNVDTTGSLAGRWMFRYSKADAGALLDGKEHREFPAAFSVAARSTENRGVKDAEAGPCAS